MEGLRFDEEEPERRKSGRAALVLLVMLPPAFLGLAYFLFVEYVLENRLPAGTTLPLTLRLGGLALVFLSLVLAGACGYLLSERALRPIRLLLQLAESGGLPASRALFLQSRDRDVHELYRLVSVLVNQNKSGARALEELERLRAALAEFREQLSRTGQHGIPAALGPLPDGPVAEIGAGLDAKRLQLVGFFRELRERVRVLRDELAALGTVAGLDGTVEPTAAAPETAVLPGEPGGSEDDGPHGPDELSIHAPLEALRQLGTVLVLESARLGGVSHERAGDLFRRFETGLEDLEAVVEAIGDGRSARHDVPPDVTDEDRGAAAAAGAEAAESLRRRWQAVLEDIDTLERRLGEVEQR